MNACQSTSSPASRPVSTVDSSTLLNQAANSQGTQRIELLLQAAAALMADGDRLGAAAALSQITEQQISNQRQADTLYRLRALVQSAEQPMLAQSQLAKVSAWQAEDFLLLADICQRTNQYSCAADGYIQASLALTLGHPALPENINDRIWQNLGRATRSPGVFVHRYHHAWWRLQQDMREAGSIAAQQQVWQRFQRRNPSHPAAIAPPTTLSNLFAYTAPTMGLFLPLTGNFSNLGKAVRDGFITAYLTEGAEAKVAVHIYDTNNQDLAQLWEQALSDGIDVAVGPLLKQNVERFAQITQFSSETASLLLNYTDDNSVTGARAYQLGIAIEDEANALAQQVLLQGHSRILLVHSADRWAERARATFEAQWPYPVAYAGFRDVKNVTQAVGEAMQVAASHTRRDQMATILGEQLEFLPRARKDLDAVITLTNQVESRALIPALQFHFAQELPVYATSQATRGDAVQELAGFNLTEIPLFAEPTTAQQHLQAAFDLTQSSQADLLALGHDAYRLATWLPILGPDAQLTLPGATGYLWLDQGRRFRRDLPMVQVTEAGLLTLVD